MNKKKPRLYNKENTTYYIHWESKFATGDNKAQCDHGLRTLGIKGRHQCI